MKCVPGSGRFHRKPLPSREKGDIRFENQTTRINTLSKYLKTTCITANINLEGQRSTNHWGKVTCATRLYESGRFDKQIFISRSRHRSTAVRSYKKPSTTLMKSLSNAPQSPAMSKLFPIKMTECSIIHRDSNCGKKDQAEVKQLIIDELSEVKYR